MASISKPYTFSAGAVIVAAEHNSNFDTIYTDYNSNITNVNIASGAAIVDTKLANITTTGKVALSALVVASQAQGDIMYASSASVWTRLGAGTDGQFLKTQGAAANPVWADALGGTYATQAEQETATSVATAVSPGRQQFHPSACKAWCSFNGTGTPAMNGTPYNFDATVTDGGQGIYSLTFTNDLSSADFCVVVTCAEVSNSAIIGCVTAKAGTGITIKTRQTDNQAAVDPTWVDVAVYGDI